MSLTLDARDRITPLAPRRRAQGAHARPEAAPDVIFLSPLRRSLAVVYGALALAAFVAPGDIRARLEEAGAGPVFGAAALAPLERLSERAGAQPLFRKARARFLDGPPPADEGLRLRPSLSFD
jgi:hypothetical protein